MWQEESPEEKIFFQKQTRKLLLIWKPVANREDLSLDLLLKFDKSIEKKNKKSFHDKVSFC